MIRNISITMVERIKHHPTKTNSRLWFWEASSRKLLSRIYANMNVYANMLVRDFRYPYCCRWDLQTTYMGVRTSVKPKYQQDIPVRSLNHLHISVKQSTMTIYTGEFEIWPTLTMHDYFQGNPWMLRHIWIVWSFPEMGGMQWSLLYVQENGTQLEGPLFLDILKKCRV